MVEPFASNKNTKLLIFLYISSMSEMDLKLYVRYKGQSKSDAHPSLIRGWFVGGIIDRGSEVVIGQLCSNSLHSITCKWERHGFISSTDMG